MWIFFLTFLSLDVSRQIRQFYELFIFFSRKKSEFFITLALAFRAKRSSERSSLGEFALANSQGTWDYLLFSWRGGGWGNSDFYRHTGHDLPDASSIPNFYNIPCILHFHCFRPIFDNICGIQMLGYDYIYKKMFFRGIYARIWLMFLAALTFIILKLGLSYLTLFLMFGKVVVYCNYFFPTVHAHYVLACT